MVVALKRSCLLLFLPGLAIAGAGIMDHQVQTQERSFAAIQLQDAKDKAEAAYLHCSDSATEATALAPNVFGPVVLTDEEKKVVLFYFSAHTMRLCTEKTARELLVAGQLARMVELPGYSMADDPHADMVSGFALGEYRRELGYKARYYALPASKRQQLEQIKALQRPFNLRESAQLLGLWSPDK